MWYQCVSISCTLYLELYIQDYLVSSEFECNQGAVSIRKTVLPCMAIPMLKIRRPNGRLIFNMGIAIPGKTVFLIETAPRRQYSLIRPGTTAISSFLRDLLRRPGTEIRSHDFVTSTSIQYVIFLKYACDISTSAFVISMIRYWYGKRQPNTRNIANSLLNRICYNCLYNMYKVWKSTDSSENDMNRKQSSSNKMRDMDLKSDQLRC